MPLAVVLIFVRNAFRIRAGQHLSNRRSLLWKVRRCRRTCYIGVSRAVYGDAESLVVSVPAQVTRIGELHQAAGGRMPALL